MLITCIIKINRNNKKFFAYLLPFFNIDLSLSIFILRSNNSFLEYFHFDSSLLKSLSFWFELFSSIFSVLSSWRFLLFVFFVFKSFLFGPPDGTVLRKENSLEDSFVSFLFIIRFFELYFVDSFSSECSKKFLWLLKTFGSS